MSSLAVVVAITTVGWVGHLLLVGLGLGDFCGSAALSVSSLQTNTGLAALASMLMVMAMMGPSLERHIAHVLDQSLPRRRMEAVLLFVVGYCASWTPIMVGIAALARWSDLAFWQGLLVSLLLWYFWLCT